MKVTNKGYINFNDKYNMKTDTMMTASMSFANGKEDDGEWKNGYINVIAFRDNIQQLESSIGQLVEIEGAFRLNEYTKLNEYTNQQSQVIKTPQIIIDKFLSGATSKPNNYPKNEKPPFSASSPVDIDGLDLPF